MGGNGAGVCGFFLPFLEESAGKSKHSLEAAGDVMYNRITIRGMDGE